MASRSGFSKLWPLLRLAALQAMAVTGPLVGWVRVPVVNLFFVFMRFPLSVGVFAIT
jgi:hypothetical protein